MKNIILSIAVALLLLSGCKAKERIVIQTVEVPRIEVRVDSITIHRTDSFVQKFKGDTVYFESYKTIYKDKIKIKIDTITKLVTVEVPVDREVVKYKWGIMSWIGLGLSLAGFAWAILKLKKIFV